ncbi:hypothetical protein [Azospirillum sp. TSO22-1]|uniref:hypothetical protein n=1 Tax=Azospirillum sp. TSO22-1 TaxID=716789 RepID=UPI000D61751A|nr:hypothetical protein [Azospirillum sp. TSO22-1]PWC31735.1 hypothetical protein TSO221_33090 [Azospirillum sp. TSO22-1]
MEGAIKLGEEHLHWLLSAAPENLELRNAPQRLIAQCAALGIVEPSGDAGVWRLTGTGLVILRVMLGA